MENSSELVLNWESDANGPITIQQHFRKYFKTFCFFTVEASHLKILNVHQEDLSYSEQFDRSYMSVKHFLNIKHVYLQRKLISAALLLETVNDGGRQFSVHNTTYNPLGGPVKLSGASLNQSKRSALSLTLLTKMSQINIFGYLKHLFSRKAQMVKRNILTDSKN